MADMDMDGSNMGDQQVPSSSGSRRELRMSNTQKINQEASQRPYYNDQMDHYVDMDNQ